MPVWVVKSNPYMKLRMLIPLFFLLCAGIVRSEKYVVTIYGTMTDGKNIGVPGIPIYITNTKNSKFIVNEKTSTLQNGLFKWPVFIDDSIKAGALLLSYINCNGKESITEVHFNQQQLIIQVKLIYCERALTPVCSSTVMVRRLNDSVSAAIVKDKGVPPFKHKWSNGQDGDSITFRTKVNARICVVSVDSVGCIAEACVTEDPNNSCKSEIILKKITDTTAIAVVIASGKSPFKYKWTNGSDDDTIRYNPNHTLGFCVLVTDATGCVSTACIANPNQCASAVLVRRISDSVAYAKVLAQGHGPFKYKWTTGATEDSIQFNPLNKNKICVTSTDSSGCSTDACVAIIPEVCGGIIERFGNVLYGYLKGDIVKSWLWSTGSDDPKIEITKPGEYCVVMHGIAGCEAKICYTVKELDTTQCTGEIVATAIPGTTPNSVQSYKLSINSKFPVKLVQWSTGDTAPYIIVKKSGEFCVTISDNVRCKLYLCKKIQLNDPSNCSLKIQIDSIPASANAALKKVKLTAVSNFDAKILVWSTGETTKSIMVEKTGKYCVTISDGIACKLQECVNIDLGAVTPPPTTGDCSSNIVVHPVSASEVKLIPRVSGIVPFTFLWTTGSKDATISVKTSGTYCVSIKDGKGCISKSCVEVSFEESGPGILPPINDNKNKLSLYSGNSKSNIDLKVYPNPSQDRVNYIVNTRQDKDGTLSVSNMYGKLVYQEKIKFLYGESRGDLDLSFLGAGVYQVTIDQDGYITTNKIVIAK